MREVIGIENLKNEFRRAKLVCGDLRGLKNKFTLSGQLGVAALHTYYHASGGNGEIRMELTADCYGANNRAIHEYTMKGLVREIKNEPGEWEVSLVCLEWNKARNDANRRTISEFIYKNKPVDE